MRRVRWEFESGKCGRGKNRLVGGSGRAEVVKYEYTIRGDYGLEDEDPVNGAMEAAWGWWSWGIGPRRNSAADELGLDPDISPHFESSKEKGPASKSTRIIKDALENRDSAYAILSLPPPKSKHVLHPLPPLPLPSPNQANRIPKVHPSQTRPAERIPHKPLQLPRQPPDGRHLVGQVLILLLPQPAPRRRRAENEPLLVVGAVGAGGVVHAREHHQRVARLELRVSEEEAAAGRRMPFVLDAIVAAAAATIIIITHRLRGRRDGVVPEVGAGDEAGGAVGAGAAGRGDEDGHARVAAADVVGGGGGLVVVGVVVAVEGLLAGAGEEAEDDGVAELGGRGAAFVLGADLEGGVWFV